MNPTAASFISRARERVVRLAPQCCRKHGAAGSTTLQEGRRTAEVETCADRVIRVIPARSLGLKPA